MNQLPKSIQINKKQFIKQYIYNGYHFLIYKVKTKDKGGK